MNEFVIRNKWLVFAAVVLAFAGLAAIASRGTDEDVASNDVAPTAEPSRPPSQVATSDPNASDDSDADSDADDDGDQTFASDDELIENPQGEDPSAGVDGNQPVSKTDTSVDHAGDPPPPANNGGSSDSSDDGGD